MKYIASLSGGKDSVALTLGLIEKGYPLDEVVYYDNGMDFKSIHDVIYNQVKPALDTHDIKLVTLHPKNNFMYDMFERPVKYRKKEGCHYGYSWCGGACRWGTTAKLRCIEEHTNGSMEYVGIASDEISRLEKERKSTKLFPLADWGWAEADCLVYCRSKGISWWEGDVDLYDVLDRVSCWCCRNKNLKELKAMWKYLPEYWEKLKSLQSRTDMPFKKYGSVFELEKRFENEEANQRR